MDEKGEFMLNNYCVFEIIDYIIANCKAKLKSVDDRFCCWSTKEDADYDDLINFALAHEFFMKLLEERHKSLYDYLEVAIVRRITMLLIDHRINKESEAESELFWKSFIQSVNERSPFNVALFFDRDSAKICTHSESPSYMKTEVLRLDVNITSQALAYICHTNQNLTQLTFDSIEVLGSISDIIPQCSNLKELRLKLKTGADPGQYAPLAKLPNLGDVWIKGLYESGLESIFFNDFMQWNRPTSMKPLTLTIEDKLTRLTPPVLIANLDTLRTLYACNYDDSGIIITEYELTEVPDSSEVIRESLETITIGHNIKIKFDGKAEKLELNIYSDSDTSELSTLAKLNNISRLIIQNMCRRSDYPESLANFLRSMATKKSLRYCEINYGNLHAIECAELAKMESLRYLSCHLSKWKLLEFASQLPNLQHAVINVREPVNSDTSKMVFKLLSTCQVQSSIYSPGSVINFIKNKKLLEVLFYGGRPKANIPASLAQLDGVKTLQIESCPDIESLRVFLRACEGNCCKIEEFNFLYGESISFKDISHVAEIQSIKKLKLNVSDTTGIEKLADLSKLEELEIYEYAIGNLSDLFTKLADKNKIQFMGCKNLNTNEVLKVSRIGSLKKLKCHISDPEDIDSLSELANSSIEEFIFTEPQSSRSLQNMFDSFSTNNRSTLQHLNVHKLDITGNAELMEIKGLKRSFEATTSTEKFWNVLDLKSVLTLQKLEIGTEIGVSECQYLVQLKMLESLKCRLRDEQGTQVLANIQNLKELTCESKGSLSELYREFGQIQESKLRELHTTITCSDEISEISKIKPLKMLTIDIRSVRKSLSNLKHLSELESLHIKEYFSFYSEIDQNSVLPVFETCTKLVCVTLEFLNTKEVDPSFVSQVNEALKCVRDSATQRPLELCLNNISFFPKFDIGAVVDAAYLTVFYTYGTSEFDVEEEFFSNAPKSDDSDF
ncbi:uncharacterized protein LOC108033627 isoform X2 [Drosophila biarmipes]|uniref:uncharacterized protein LOC108033627 isoform X2 n=1 Tax=Drosophila biarmipes TaxID=125945 RepID=UPI0007E6CA92|nr:uncharacterized protein LOC108033627 isoform X2 [Drosophila biarmipes]